MVFPADTERSYNWRDFETVFGELEQVAYQIDRSFVFLFCRQYDVPDLHRDAALERLRRFRNRRVLIDEIRPGSWEFVVAFAATAGFVLWKTLGETILDGYRETRFRQELKDFTRVGSDWLMLNVTDKLRTSKEFLSAKIERREREVVLRLPGPAADENRLPTRKGLIEEIDRDR